MNPFYKCFCRVYQFLFHLALPVLPYRNPKIISSVEDLPEELKKNGINRVLLITDNFLRSSGITASLEEKLADVGVHCSVYDSTRPNPTVENVEQAREMYISHNCQCMIAFGGGSSIDCAKALGARIAYPKRSLKRLKGNLKVLRKTPPLVAIPTTAGTGSEVTVTAVITDTQTQHKYTMNNFPFIPDWAVLDPKVTVTLPPALTATTGVDALTHAVEVYIGNSTSRETREMSVTATQLIFKSIEKAYNYGNDLSARADMLRAAHLAGAAFSKSYVGYVHALAHALGGQYNTPHGLANSVLLPVLLEAYGTRIHRKLYKLALAVGIADNTMSCEEGAHAFITAVKELNKRLSIPEKLPEIQSCDIPKMARHAAREGNPLYPVPVLMTAKELESFYYKISDWSED